MRALSLYGGLLALALGVILAGSGAVALPQSIVLIRHRDKDRATDSEAVNYNLSEIGFVHALDLSYLITACLLQKRPLHLVSYGFDPITGKNARSYQTLTPLAVVSGVNIRLFPEAATNSVMIGQELLSDPRYDHAVVVAAWEHRRLPDLAKGLGWIAMPDVQNSDFDSLWLLDYSSGAFTPVVTRYSQQQLRGRRCFSAAETPRPPMFNLLRHWLNQVD